jgi:PurA ssDNA and RNA-binding protein
LHAGLCSRKKTSWEAEHRTSNIEHRTSNFGQGPDTLPKHTNEQILKSESAEIERKRFRFALKWNRRGYYLRITEEAGCHRDNVVMPASGIPVMLRILEDMQRLIDRHKNPGTQIFLVIAGLLGC